jgi:hypothetical protein
MAASEMKRGGGGSAVLPIVLGCVGGGCLIVVIAIVVVGIMVGSFVKDVKGLVADTPAVSPYAPTPVQTAALDEKLAAVSAKLQTGQGATLELTPAELNTLIANEQAKANAPNPIRVLVEIKGDTVFGKASIPFAGQGGPAKYLNGEADLNVRIANGQLEVYVRDFRVTDRQMPKLFKTMIASVKQQNLAQDFNTNPQHAAAQQKLRQVESLEVRDGKIHLKLKPQPTPVAPPAAPQPGAAGNEPI